MPRRRRPYNKKKNYNRRRRRRKAVIPKPVTGIPPTQRVKLKYVEFLQTNSFHYQYAFCGNSIFDPDRTGTGHQPTGYDEWGAFYGNWIVHSSAIKVTAVSQSTLPGNSNGIITIMPKHAYTDTIDYRSSDTLPGAKSRMVAGNASGPIHMRNYGTTRYMKAQKGQVIDQDFMGTTTSSPGESNIWFWYIVVDALDGATAQLYDIKVEITYYVEFMNPIFLGIS